MRISKTHREELDNVKLLRARLEEQGFVVADIQPTTQKAGQDRPRWRFWPWRRREPTRREDRLWERLRECEAYCNEVRTSLECAAVEDISGSARVHMKSALRNNRLLADELRRLRGDKNQG